MGPPRQRGHLPQLARAWILLLSALYKGSHHHATYRTSCSVFGGMTTFLFANVIASGVKIIVGEWHSTKQEGPGSRRPIPGCLRHRGFAT